MFENWKRSNLEKKFDKNLSKYKRKRKTSQKKVLTVGIITTDEISSKLEIQKEVESFLNVRNTKILNFRNFNELDTVSYKYFTEKDINWSGLFKLQSLKIFLDEPFDLLIGYFNEDHLYLKMAVLKSKATFKAGFSGVNEDLYEMGILGNIENPNQFASELKKYLKILRKLNFK